MKLTLFSKFLLAISILLFKCLAFADACTDSLSSTVASFNANCTGTVQCWLPHPEGYNQPTGVFVPVATATTISGGNLILSCKAGASCPMYTHPGATIPQVSAPLCSNQPFIVTAIQTAQNLHSNNRLICGSIVGVDDQTLGESIPLKGAKFSLNYFTHFNAGRGNYSIVLPLTGATAAPSTTSFNIKVLAADGEYANVTLMNQANLKYVFAWDGKKLNGQVVNGSQGFKIQWTQNFSNGSPTVTMSDAASLGGFNAKALGIGGWVPSIYQYYNSSTQQLYSGDGGVRFLQASAVTNIVGVAYRVAEPDRSYIHYFDSLGRLVFTTTGTTGTKIFTFNYDTSGRLLSILEPFSLQTIFARTSSGELYNIEAPKGYFDPPAGVPPGTNEYNPDEDGFSVTRVSFTASGYLRTVRTLDYNSSGFYNPFWEMSYDNRGLLTSFKSPNGHTSTYTYDLKGNLIRNDKPNGFFFNLVKNQLSPYQFTVMKSDSSGYNSTSTVTESGNGFVNRATVNPGGFQESAVFSSLGDSYSGNGITRSNTYTSDPVVAGVQYPTAETISFGSASLTKNTSRSLTYGTGALLTVNSGTVTQTFGTSRTITTYTGSSKTYRTYRQRVGTTAGPATVVVVDAYERPISIKHGSLNATTISYADDSLSSVIQGGNSTYYKYSSKGQLTASGETANSYKIYYLFDVEGRLSGYLSANANGPQVRYTFDSNGNVASMQANPSITHLFSFNLNDTVSSWATPLNRTTSYLYNLDKSLAKVTKPSGHEINYFYNASSGKLVKVSTLNGDTNYSYNPTTGVLSSVQSSEGFLTEIISDGAIPKAIKTSTPSLTEIGTFAVNRNTSTGLVSSDVVSVGSVQSAVNYSYNLDLMKTQVGDMTIQYDANDLISGNTIGGIVETYARDTDGFVTTRTVAYNGVTKFKETLTLNNKKKATQITQVRAPIADNYTDDVGYDLDYRLSSHTRTYSSGGPFPYPKNYYYTNPVTQLTGNNSLMYVTSGSGGSAKTTYTYDVDDQLTNLKQMQLLTTLRNVDYTYTNDGVMATKSDSLDTSYSFVYDDFGNLKQVTLQNGTVISYEIDGFNRRIGKKVNGVLQKRWIYQDQTRIAAEVDANGAITKRFVYATDKHVPDYMIIGSEKYKLVADRLGSIKLILKVSDGSVAYTRSFDQSGEGSTVTDPNFIPFGFAGGLDDSHTKLVRFGARDYDAVSGRWTAKDPIGFAGGDSNLYGYVANDPINFIDPTGLVCQYSQGTGQMTCSDASGKIYYDQAGYAGTSAGRNNSSMQSIQNIGPIPRGKYVVSSIQDSVQTGPNTFTLTPDLATSFAIYSMGRDIDLFRIHGNNKRNDASTGCIILPPNRSKIPVGEVINVVP